MAKRRKQPDGWTRIEWRTGKRPACPHCGKEPSLEDFQAGRCPDTGEPLDPWAAGERFDVHGTEDEA